MTKHEARSFTAGEDKQTDEEEEEEEEEEGGGECCNLLLLFTRSVTLRFTVKLIFIGFCSHDNKLKSCSFSAADLIDL